MMKTEVKVGTLASFFEEGRQVARLADEGKPLPEVRSITFENREDMLEYLPARLGIDGKISPAIEPAK